ncbi:MAG TPA: hypothetical protein VJ044_05945 [Candidatus Hodarchaeales archaeon]|nr:hypothetical protein [Candidatus Hodarchaeales archaeon]
MAWRQDAEYQKRLQSTRTSANRDESIRMVRTNISQIIEALTEVREYTQRREISAVRLDKLDEWFWERNQKAKSSDAEKKLAFMNRIRRYFRIAFQLGNSSDKIHADFDELVTFFTELLDLFSSKDNSDNLSLWDRIEILEEILFPRTGRRSGRGPNDA